MAKKKSLRKLSREEPTKEELSEVFREIEKGSDKHAAIVMSAYLEGKLNGMLVSFFGTTEEDLIASLYEKDGPLGSFYSSIHLARALGLITPVICEHLNTIRVIRNTFAHSQKAISFHTPEIENECKKIKATSKGRYRILRRDESDKDNPQRFVFMNVASGLIIRFSKQEIRNYKKLARKLIRRHRQRFKMRRLRVSQSNSA